MCDNRRFECLQLKDYIKSSVAEALGYDDIDYMLESVGFKYIGKYGNSHYYINEMCNIVVEVYWDISYVRAYYEEFNIYKGGE